MYEKFFGLETLPFCITPNPQFFCELNGHREALKTLIFSVKSGEGFIKIVGEVGAGKTLLSRKLLENLGEEYVTAYIPNPDLSPLELRKAVAREIHLDPTLSHDQHELLTAINQHLIQLYKEGKKVILIIDEAQALSDESLETVRLLTNFETQNQKLLQVVLFGQPELEKRINEKRFRQLKQRITFSYILPLMNKQDLHHYLAHRLSIAGNKQPEVFNKKAKKLLYKASRGIPRIINVLSHKALLIAYGQGERLVNKKIMSIAIADTESALKISKWSIIISSLLGISVSALLLFVIYSLTN